MGVVKLVFFDRTYFVLSKKWLSDSEINALTAAGKMPSDEERENWYATLQSRSDYKIWGVEYDNIPIGVCGIRHILDGEGEWWMYIGEKDYWGKGIGGQILLEIQGIAKQNGMTRLFMRVLKDNVRCIKLHEKHGFIYDGQDEEFHIMSKNL